MLTEALFSALVFLALLLPVGQMARPFLPRPELIGVQKTAERPVLSLSGLWSKAYQKGLEAWFNQNYGLHEGLVKTDRQLYYSLFGAVHDNEGIIVGNDGQLVGDFYVKGSLQFNPPSEYGALAAGLARASRELRARGKAFVVMITPSKTSTYPDVIPAAYTRYPHYAPDEDYRRFLAALRGAGVPVVDAKQVVAELAASSPHRLFPRGGIHWNEVAATVAAQALLKRIEALTGRAIGRISIQGVDYDKKPVGSDADYAWLLNVWSPPLDYEAAHVRAKAVPGPAFGRLRLVMAGDSFLDRLFTIYNRLGLFKKVTDVAYNARLIETPGREGSWRAIGGPDRARLAAESDVVVLEVNDNIIPRTTETSEFVAGYLQDLSDRLGFRLAD